MERPRVLVVSFTIHGMVNPALRFAERLAAAGAEVTFATPISAHRKIVEPRAASAAVPGVSFAPFSDGFDSGYAFGRLVDAERYDSEITSRGSRAVAELIAEATRRGRPFACVVYTPVVTWAAKTAEELGIPAVLLWVQPATLFDVIHAYFHGYEDLIDELFSNKDLDKPLTELSRALGLPLDLTVRDLPNFMDASSPQAHYAKYFREDFERFGVDTGQRRRSVLVNTFDALEPEALRALTRKNLNLIAIGPLMDEAPAVDRPLVDETFEWLSSRPRGSVVYVAFGSLSVLAERQMDEVAEGLAEFGRPFLWVVRGEKPSRRREELEKLGLIVPWCDQVGVLRSGAVSCFVSHCGWNSTFESLVMGVPVVGFPQRIDQFTNAKLIEDYWRVGVRVRADDESGVVDGGEIKRCLETVVGGEEFRNNANKWKGLAGEALAEGGSSVSNLKAFLNDISNGGNSGGSLATSPAGNQ